MLRWLRTIRNSRRPSGTSGSAFMRAGSSPARMAAVPSNTAADAPEVTMPASAPVASRMMRLAAA